MDGKKISSGSINFRITASAWVGMLCSFLLLDAVFLAAMFGPKLVEILGNGGWQAFLSFLTELLRQPPYQAAAAAEGVLLLLKIVLGSRNVRHKLQPMERISQMAMDLGSQEGDFDGEQLHMLEDAIDRISPTSEDAGLNTGNKELVGLELAVNGLIRRMRESYQQQARFVSDASHELRTPIAVIKGYADMLDRWGMHDETVLNESIEAIRTESEHMSYLVEQLLFLARGDSGRMQLRREFFDLSLMMEEVLEESRMIDPQHEYLLESGGPIRLSGDVSLLKQTARILIDNAAKYAPAGSQIRLRTSCGNGECSFSVTDSGSGISGENLPHLFERFFRADDSRARETGGSGLGLAIAKWIVDRHGGRFRVVSREGLGTKFTVLLPLPGQTAS